MGGRHEEAAQEGNVEFFKALSNEELVKLIEKTDEDGRTALHLAVAGGHSQLVELLVNSEVGKRVANNADDEVLAFISNIMHLLRAKPAV
jgi:ankyrin repeat protein